MQTVHALTDPSSLNPSFLNSLSLVVSDVDHTLTDSHECDTEGAAAVGTALDTRLGREVDAICKTLMVVHQGKQPRDASYESLLAEITDLQNETPYGKRTWCREAWIIIAARRLQINLSAQVLVSLRDRYWDAFTRSVRLYDDARVFLDALNQKSVPLILMSGSDAVMRVNDDLTLTYDPEFSASYKQKRIDLLNLDPVRTFLGDPYDKPLPAFFTPIFSYIETKGIDKTRVLFVGDSERTDLAVPRDYGFRTLLVSR